MKMRAINLVLRVQILITALVAILSVSACTTTPISETLEIYFVDVEGGQATLIVMPGGESLLFDAGYPGRGKPDPVPGIATLAAFQPRVAILNNGATKGGSAPIFDVLHNAEGLEDVWQLHLSEAEGAENYLPERIANLDSQTANWIKLTAETDGSFRILNGRTEMWKNYDAR